ncbi:MAG: GNAT family N-acetyltransferase [Phycisphaerae bacterium]|nr:GNAT family N-acetyltransferase [Phycisphaerae bacterium]
MNSNTEIETVKLLPPGSRVREQALRLVLSGSARPDLRVEQRIQILEDTVAAQGMNTDMLIGALKERQLVAAGLVIEAPGRSAIIHLSPLGNTDRSHSAAAAVLHELQKQAWQRGIILLQAMASPHEVRFERLLAESGFEFLAELFYADCARGTPFPSPPHMSDVHLLTYAPHRHAEFLRGLEQTYVDSLDCPRLGGIRQTADILSGHRATGCHDPSLWFLAQLDGETAGILLLSPQRGRHVLEVAYMGVVQSFRRRGVAHVLMRKCMEEMLARDFSGVTLAVDSANTPARALYRKWGFRETTSRRAWIAVQPSQHE